MATLNIGGTKVKVGDEFLRMTPEQQGAAVEEISASLGLSASQPTPAATSPAADANGVATPPSGLRPGTREYADWAAQAARAQVAGGQRPSLPQVGQNPNAPEAVYRDALERARRTQFPDMTDEQWAVQSQLYAPTINGQVAQATTLNFADELAGVTAGIGAEANRLVGGRSTGFGRAFEDVQALEEARYKLAQQQNGGLGTAAEITGSLATLGPGSALAQAPGLIKTAFTSGVTGGILGGVQGFGAASGDLEDRVEGANAGARAGATIGAAVPLGTAAISTAGRLGYNAVAPAVRSALDPVAEATRRVGTAIGRDRANGQGISVADEAVANASNIPLTNIDRGGEVARALGRSVANQNPEARATLTSLAQDRYKGQSGRAVDFINRLTGGKVDDLAYQDTLRKNADLLNDVNYKAAERAPGAQAIFTADLQELMQSPSIQRAIDAVGETGADLAAISGQMPVTNPFRKGSDGVWRVVQKANGTLAVPNLRFWDQVKRNLDPLIEQAQRGSKPNRYQAQILTQLKGKLTGALDAAVPEYATARAGASAAFGADNAIDAGRIFARQPGQIPEATRAFGKMNAAEKEAFSVGYASELIDRIKVRGDSQNVIKQAFESPAAREMNELVFGKSKAAQLEAYVRVEALADALRNSLGNSTTARQLVELGLGGIGGFTLSGDWTGAITGAAIARGGRYAGEKIDARVMENVAKLLVSGSRADLDKAVANAMLSPQWMAALKRLSDAVSVSGGPLAVMATN